MADDDETEGGPAAAAATGKRAASDPMFAVEQAYGLTFGADIEKLLGVARAIHPTDPLNAFVSTLGLRLVGPFALLAAAGTAHGLDCMTGRRYFDPPELVNCLDDTNDPAGRHIGVYRDLPEQEPLFVCAAWDREDSQVVVVGTDLLHFVWRHAVRILDLPGHLAGTLGAIKRLLHPLTTAAYFEGTLQVPAYDARKARVMGSTFHGLGVVGVPEHYREVYLTDDELRRVLANLVSAEAAGGETARALEPERLADDEKELYDLLTCVDLANDEGDPTTSVQVGLNLWTYSRVFAPKAAMVLRTAYTLLGRPQFAAIASRRGT